MDALFAPESIAIIGASRSANTVSGQILKNLLAFGFQGVVYPVNPKARHINSVPAYPSVLDIPGSVDLAIIVIPVRYSLAAVEQCIEKGVKALLVITAGFREIGGEGIERERELLHLVNQGRMRMVGPNCMGLINTDPAVRMDATFSPLPAREGGIAFLSQSGALGIAILNHAHNLQVGFSAFVSVGNSTDVGVLDLLRRWEHDERAKTILMYLESVGEPRAFFEIARRTTRRKPMVVLKSGRTKAGARAAASHTGSMATADFVIDALMAQSGVIRVTSVNALFDVGAALTMQPLPRGRRVGIVTNAGGPAIMATDALIGAGLELAELTAETEAAIREFAPPEASVHNPIDLIASADPLGYRKTLELLGQDPNVDAILVIYVPPVAELEEEVADAIVETYRKHGKTTLATFMGRGASSPGALRMSAGGIPNYLFPEAAVRTLMYMDRYREWRERDLGHLRHFEVDRKAAKEVFEAAKEATAPALDAAATRKLLNAYGIPQPAEWTAERLEDVDLAALPYPVVLKAIGPEITHKTEFGGVVLDIGDREELLAARDEIQARIEAAGVPARRWQVQQMVQGVAEVILGHTLDPKFGPILMYGTGGTQVELLKDVTFRLAPITDAEARRMIRATKGFPLLQGFRGAPVADVAALEDLLLRVSKLVVDHYEIAEIDFNPIIVGAEGEGLRVVDTVIRLGY